ncbi:hypothetical protein NDU88_003919 [Pleurodeles waltl]|uniref:Uncharacterized protein n=1 Tax=Pleurodeles waltl TaxID=8319 RepID=A0AAV7WUD2_PLEWA|nr:hypothetical protein NDU88_003919 [Pleurodeles waltl]
MATLLLKCGWEVCRVPPTPLTPPGTPPDHFPLVPRLHLSPVRSTAVPQVLRQRCSFHRLNLLLLPMSALSQVLKAPKRAFSAAVPWLPEVEGDWLQIHPLPGSKCSGSTGCCIGRDWCHQPVTGG